MLYAEARSLVKTGDHVGICNTAPLSKLVVFGQRFAKLENPTVSHSGIAVWLNDRLMLVEMSAGGNTLRYLSQYKQFDMVVSAPPVSLDDITIWSALDSLMGTHKPYSLGDFAKIGWRLFRLRFEPVAFSRADSDEKLVCSEFSARFYQELGWSTNALPNRPCPAELVSALKRNFWVEGLKTP